MVALTPVRPDNSRSRTTGLLHQRAKPHYDPDVATAGTETLRYLRASALADGKLDLQTSGGRTPVGTEIHPHFFTGFLTCPEESARALLAVADVAAARYYRPRSPTSLDPVITANGDRLRFESFSGCCGVYARYDVLESGLDGDLLERGTTNIDVNAPLREALARVGAGAPLHLAVGPDEVTTATLDDTVVEKKVPIPARWVRGFAESAVLLGGMDVRAEIDAVEARRFLRALPKRSRGEAMWAEPAGRGLRLTTRPSASAVCLAGPERLATLEPLLRFAKGLRVYGPPVTGTPAASAWELTLPSGRLLLTLSPDASRGFSGEGAVLDVLATDHATRDAELVAAELAWDASIDIGELADATALPPERLRAALVQLGTAGQVGYDVVEAAYFHRELPYDVSRAEKDNPRLRNARRLVAEGAVRIDGNIATVTVDDHAQFVRLLPDGAMSCTCTWWAKYGGSRGPCKHVLAVRLVRTS